MYSRYILEGEVFTGFSYPAGEWHHRFAGVAIPSGSVIEAHVRDFEGLCRIVTEDRILRRIGIVVRWFVPYFPFARHDRRNDANDGFELEVAMGMVKELDIVIADPHSDVAGMLPHIPQSSAFDVFLRHGAVRPGATIAIPDGGATKKALGWLGKTDNRVIQCRKRRNPQTGKLSDFVIDNDTPDVPVGDVVMLDDICDGGYTFTELGKMFREEHGATSLRLCVTHGLMTKGLDVLTDVFDCVFYFRQSVLAGGVIGDVPRGVTAIDFKELYDEGVVI